MAKSLVVWTCITSFSYILPSICTDATKTSKACFGIPGLSCTQHNIRCRRNRTIVIHDAYYTDNIECGQAGISDCGTVNPDNVTERGYHRFSNIELVSIFNQCSTATLCGYPAPQRSAALEFSVVKYQCIDNGDSLNISGGSAEGVSQVSLFHKVLPISEQQTNMYVCNFKCELNTESISLYVLDARLRLGTPGQCFSQLSVLHGNYITTSSCSTVFQPFERLNVTQDIPLYIYSEGIPRLLSGFIWLLVNASEPFNVTCETVERTTPGGITTESTNDRSPASTPQLISGEITTWPNKDVLPISRFPPGVFMGGVVAGAVIVILVCLAVYVLVIRRRYDLTARKQGDTPACVEHPTYSGLSARADVNNYAIIEQTSRSQGDTTHGSTATTDYQNI